MKSSKLHPSKLSKGLLALFLFFGLFTFSGLTTRIHTGQHQTAQTELVIGLAQQHNKRQVSYYQKLQVFQSSALNRTSAFHALVTYSQRLDIRFKVQGQIYRMVDPPFAIPLKTIPQSSKDEPYSSPIG